MCGQVNPRLIGMIALLVIMAGLAVWQFSGGSARDRGPVDTAKDIDATGMVILDDGSLVPRKTCEPVDGQEYRFRAGDGREGFAQYVCLRTMKTWAYGKNGQITSPFVDAQGNPR